MNGQSEAARMNGTCPSAGSIPLRDWMAGQAMNAMMNAMMRVHDNDDGLPVTQNGSVSIAPGRVEWVATIAYQQADAMLKARKSNAEHDAGGRSGANDD